MRKPAHLHMLGGKEPRQRIWEEVRKLRKFGFGDLRGELSGAIQPDTIRVYLRSLVAAGYVTASLSGQRTVYELTKDCGVEAPRLRKDGTAVTMGLAQEQLWRTLQILRTPMTPLQLAAQASTPEVRVHEVAARDYLENLCRAGYLQRQGEGARAKYQLEPGHNSGPRAPQVQRIRQVYDPNWDRVVWRQPDAEGDD